MAQLVKCCLCNHEDLSLDFSKMLGMVARTYNSNAGQPETEGSLNVGGQSKQLDQ